MVTAISLAIETCDREPIHIPGSIQPHGVLLALNCDTLVVEQIAGDTASLLGVAPMALVGCPVEDCIGAASTAWLRDVIGAQRTASRPAYRAIPRGSRQPLDALVHQASGVVVLELEPSTLAGADQSLKAFKTLLDGIRGGHDLVEYYQALTESVKELTGFDRVMIYRFLADGTGVVEAECCSPGVDCFLGLHYPASDIPAQARALYLINWIRMIADVGYIPARLHPALNPSTGQALDLSLSTLRSVSPIHLEYLRNMGVAASMSISIVVRGQLWGLIACHHRVPHLVPYKLRAACELFAEMTSLQLEARLATQQLRAQFAGKSALEDLIQRLSRELVIPTGLSRYQQELLAYLPADGFAVYAEGEVSCLGQTPNKDQIGALVEWLRPQDIRIFETDHLSRVYLPSASFADTASGLLALALTTTPPLYLLWFRGEHIQSVTWAGNPDKVVDIASRGHLNPRTSFAAWQASMRMRSQPWEVAAIAAANSLRIALLEVVLRQIDDLAKERAVAQKQQNLLMAELDHRVKNMLATIQAIAGQSGAGSISVEDFLATFEGRLHAMSRAHNLLTKSRWEGADLRSLITEELAPFMIPGGASRVMLSSPGTIMLRPKSALALSLALHELVTNAAKYGAFSTAAGKVAIDWRVEQRASAVLVLNWQESGGPPVSRPRDIGFGRNLIESNLAYETAGSAELSFAPEGLQFTAVMPWDQTAAQNLPLPASETQMKPLTALAGMRILVVEDNGLVARSMIMALKAAGADILGPAARLSAASDLARDGAMDAATLDIDLDGRMVWPVADLLDARGVPFLFCSGFHPNLLIPPRFQDRPVLNKPFKMSELKAAVLNLLAPSGAAETIATP
jgi:light-regulated signal transduction histidine kinase (bacteriophytochrome)